MHNKHRSGAKETQGMLFIDHLWFNAVWIMTAVMEMLH